MKSPKNNQSIRIYGTVAAAVSSTFIVAYNEDLSKLITALRLEGLDPRTIRKDYAPEEKEFSPIIKCMMTHMEAWRRCLEVEGICLVVEADFVPVVGFGEFYLPYDISKPDQAIGYLYSGGPQFYDMDNLGFARGHAGTLVAYTITATTAELLLKFGQEILENHDPKEYYPFDAGIGFYLKDLGVQSYLTYRMLGEHGGVPNPEHRAFGLSKTHRADTLANKLHFLPLYANASRFKFFLTRCYAKMHGIGRLIFLKYLSWHDFKRSNKKWRVLKFSIFRHFTFF